MRRCGSGPGHQRSTQDNIVYTESCDVSDANIIRAWPDCNGFGQSPDLQDGMLEVGNQTNLRRGYCHCRCRFASLDEVVMAESDSI